MTVVIKEQSTEQAYKQYICPECDKCSECGTLAGKVEIVEHQDGRKEMKCNEYSSDYTRVRDYRKSTKTEVAASQQTGN